MNSYTANIRFGVPRSQLGNVKALGWSAHPEGDRGSVVTGELGAVSFLAALQHIGGVFSQTGVQLPEPEALTLTRRPKRQPVGTGASKARSAA